MSIINVLDIVNVFFADNNVLPRHAL